MEAKLVAYLLLALVIQGAPVDAACEAYEGTTSGTGVTNCYADRALTDARARCNQLITDLKPKFDSVTLCENCPGRAGQTVWLTGQVNNYFDAGSCGITGCSGRSCSYSARYGCCVDTYKIPRQPAGQPSNRADDSLKLTDDGCGCTQSNRNPVTGATVSCTCYFNNQAGASKCPGARYGPSSQRWYRDC